MFLTNAIKRFSSTKVRHGLASSLPASIRHSVIDVYVYRQMAALKSFKRAHGADWLERMPRWRDTFDNTVEPAKLITEYWRTIDLGGNAPRAYALSDVRWDADWLVAQANRLLPQKGTVLDFGCNAGRVLHRFIDAGYRGIGVDINPEAVELGKQTFAQFREATFVIDDGPEALKTVQAGSADFIYPCGVLRHIAPEKIDAVIEQFARINPRYIATVEDEASFDHHNFPHDYRQKFGARGFSQIQQAYGVDLRTHGDVIGLGSMLQIYSRC